MSHIFFEDTHLKNKALLGYLKNFELNTRNVRLKRNLFIYAKYFQWFTRCLSWFVSVWRGEKDRSMQLKMPLHRNKLIFFFITKKQFSFLTVLARGIGAANNLLCLNMQWDPLMFFFIYKQMRDRLAGFFPIFFIDPNLLSISSFKQNFISNFIKHPVFFVWDFTLRMPATLGLFKKMYPLFIPTGYGLYLFLFWLRFILKFK